MTNAALLKPFRAVRRFGSQLVFGGVLAALTITGCDVGTETTAPERLVPGEVSFSSELTKKPEICHRNKDGSYVKISISDAAYDTHVAHGDIAVGTGGLGADCQPSPTCPCYSADDIDPNLVGGWLGMGDEGSSLWDLALLDLNGVPLGFSTTAAEIIGTSTIGYTCGEPLQEGLTRAQGEDCKAIILEYGDYTW